MSWPTINGVTIHAGRPAVNVKIHTCLHAGMPVWTELAGEFPGFSLYHHDQIHEKTREAFWQDACSDGWDQLEEDARAIFGESAKVYSEGRSGGWAVVEYTGTKTRADVEDWEPADFDRWAKFETAAKAITADTWYRYLWALAANVWEPVAEGERAMIAKDYANGRHARGRY